MTRSAIPDFELGNPLYVAATVSFYTVNAAGASTGILATLYADRTSSVHLANPQALDSEGKFAQPVYIDEAVVGHVTGPHVGSHSTGVIPPSLNAEAVEDAEDAANWAWDLLRRMRGVAVRAAASAAAAAASAASITLPVPIASGGTGATSAAAARTNLSVPGLDGNGDLPYSTIPDEVADAANLAMYALAR